jgi:hypothetical protein
MGNSPVTQIHFKFAEKVIAPTRNNDKTSVIDCGGYRSSFNVFLSPMVSSFASHDGYGVSFEWRALEQGWQRRQAPAMGTQAYIGAWEENGRIKIQIRDKI